ncbi:hypothetical protein FN976_24345 [Caenimonas sedimenti]|uniref:Lipoprotein n=1 Tax=Caenimonas sedimenti TaxID=2596921 RepID=A0A562ZHJ9_9BURK|nr:hypothetical protein [Caenimonas sedimenti]TWO68070.1 hypothetical protein FN976_24345 [Caenimonas sedimenti]
MKRKIHLLVYLALASLVGACALRPSEREMNYLASALTKVSAGVDATVRFRPPPAGASEAEVLQMSTAHDPGLLKPFADYTVRVQRSGRASAVLVCDRGGSTALLEDAGCTAKLDEHRWSASTPQRCEFTLDLSTVCGR